jgi:hypothetical protein
MNVPEPFATDQHQLADLEIIHHVREGRFQRSLALIAGLSSALSGLEVAYEHYRGSYSNRIMYTPVILSQALLAAGVYATMNRRAARTILPAVSALTLADCVIGFGFHIRGIQRKPGGWRIPVFNVIMGPPLFAPLLFGMSAYLGLIASFLRRENDPSAAPPRRVPLPLLSSLLPQTLREDEMTELQEVREGRFQKHLSLSTAVAAFFSGFEALYSHYKNNFRYKVQWSPIIIAVVLMGTALAAIWKSKVAKRLLPAVSALAIADGSVGFLYHARGLARRRGGSKHLLYNIMYGPPILAPLLFSAAGFLGLLASMFRRESSSSKA